MDSLAARKARGAFFTPPELAAYVTRWAVRSAADRIFEPSCGEAEFLLQAGLRLRDLGSPSTAWPSLLRGVEIHEDSAVSAVNRLRSHGLAGTVLVDDFFDVEHPLLYDVVLGNPPYVRYQDFSGVSRAKSARAALAQGVRLSGLASSWAAFVLHASGLLEPEGRLALVLPAELLSVGYASEVRSFLLRRFAKIKLVTFEERVFPGVLEDVVLLLAEGSGGAEFFELHQSKNTMSLAAGTEEQWTEYSPVEGAKWTSALLADQSFRTYEHATANFETMRDWGRTYLGSVSGGNKYFSITADQLGVLGLEENEVLKISPPGSRHLRGLEFSDAAWRAELRAGRPGFLFYPPDQHSSAAEKYINFGVKSGISGSYKCQVRSPWWRVPLVEVPDLVLTYMNHDRPRLVTNGAGARILNSVYGVGLKHGRKILGRKLLPLACLNSVTLLGAEVVGRAYGGGLLKLEPREADKLPVPSLQMLQDVASELQAIGPQVGGVLRSGDVSAATVLVDGVLLRGLSSEELASIRLAREFLFQRRKARAASV